MDLLEVTKDATKQFDDISDQEAKESIADRSVTSLTEQILRRKNKLNFFKQKLKYFKSPRTNPDMN